MHDYDLDSLVVPFYRVHVSYQDYDRCRWSIATSNEKLQGKYYWFTYFTKKEKCYLLMVSNNVIHKPKSYLNPGPIIFTLFIDVHIVNIYYIF